MVPVAGKVALHCRKGGSQTPDRRLNGSRNTHLANALKVSTDSILNGIITVQDKYYDNRIYDIIYDCDNNERAFLIEVLQASKDNLRKYQQELDAEE